MNERETEQAISQKGGNISSWMKFQRYISWRNCLLFGVPVFLIVIVVTYNDLISKITGLPCPSTAGEFGDQFGTLSALFSGLAFVGLMVTILLQRDDLRIQREEIKKSQEESEWHRNQEYVFKLVELYLKECHAHKLQKNGFIFDFFEYMEFGRYTRRHNIKTDIKYYHEIRVEASLFLGALEYVEFRVRGEQREVLKLLLKLLITVNRQRDYYSYLHITTKFPRLFQVREKLKEEGFFTLSGLIDSEDKLQRWGRAIQKKLVEANKTCEV